MGFWDKMEGAAKWITDPKQLLTGVGFALGGPPGAAAGRTVGGTIPQAWGDRPSSLEGEGDLGRLLKDAATGYGAGTVAQHVPGLQNLEGSLTRAFAGSGGAATGFEGLGALQQPAMYQGGGYTNPSMGMRPLNPPPTLGAGAQQLAFQAPNQSMIGGQYGGSVPTPAAGAATPGAGAATPGLTPMAQEAGSMPPWMQQTMDRATGPGAPFEVPNLASNFNAQFSGQAGVQRALGEGGGVLGKVGEKVGGFWGDLSGLEKAYLAAQVVPPITEAISGDRNAWSEGGTDLFAEMYARHPQGRTPRSYSDWSRGR